MTIGQDNALATPVPDAEPKPNSFQRIIGVLFSPDATFASIARRPDWVVPLVLIVIIALANGVLTASHIDFGAPAREAMAQNKNVTQEQMDRFLDSLPVKDADPKDAPKSKSKKAATKCAKGKKLSHGKCVKAKAKKKQAKKATTNRRAK